MLSERWTAFLMATVPLHRRFNEWRDDADDRLQPRRRRTAGSNGPLSWSDLLAKRRVVILAEAGSGKTEELTEQARLQAAAGKFSFYATVQDVGHDGLEQALRRADRPLLQAWLASSESAWFFIDSVDEAKLDGIRLDRALRHIADGIAGAEGRAHIILSGRHTDWEFTRDARRFSDELPLPKDPISLPLPTLEELIRRVLRHEKPEEPPPPETHIVVVMAALDAGQVRKYAAAKNAPDVEGLVAAIDAANLWEFARRPLDLDWIVRYWKLHKRLGSLEAMIDQSLDERVRETNPDRSRVDPLDHTRARHALERIGAALVFGRQTTIAIPDKDAPDDDNRASITLDDVLPDWSPTDRNHLLTRPAFDPATFGRARLHNDNEGVVRAFLTARWLLRLRQSNLSQSQLHHLLFSRPYGIDLVKPSMLETAAWLSLRDESVANEVVRRAPFLLFTAGDPASLPVPTRKAALLALVERMKRSEDTPMLDHSSVARFAQPDIAPVLREIWEANKDDQDIRFFVLRLMWLGKLHECVDIAEAASFGGYQDRYTAILAGRVLLATNDESRLQAYAEYIKRDCASITTTAVWEAVEALFPRLINVEDLLAILASIKVGDDEGGGFNLDWHGASLVEKLSSAKNLSRLIEGMLSQLGNQPEPDTYDLSSLESQYSPALATAAKLLFELSPPDEAPVAALDALLRLGDRRFTYLHRRAEDLAEIAKLANHSPARRRIALWHTAGRLEGHPTLYGHLLLHPFQLRFLGWDLDLQLEDVDWLLADAPKRASATERRLGINTALALWFNEGNKDEALRDRIAAVAATDAEMQAAYTEWMTPREQTADEIEAAREMAEIRQTGEQARSQLEQGWFDFISDLRSNPAQLQTLTPTTTNRVDGRIYDLWQLMNQATRSSSRYAVDSIAPIASIVGDEVAAGLLKGLSEVWRAWMPTLHSDRPPHEKNQISDFDCMCIAGVSLEAASRPNWTADLNEQEAIRAAQFATLEINGFPEWLFELAAAWPPAVAQVLAKEAADDLDIPAPGVHHQILEYIDRSPKALATLLWPDLWRELQARPTLSSLALRPLLPTLVRGLSDDHRLQFYALVIDRFKTSDDPQISAQYLGAAYAVDAARATDALVEKLDLLGDAQKQALVERALPHIFGSRWSSALAQVPSMDVPTLERLVVLAFKTVRPEEDRDRANKGAYSPDERDKAEAARSSALEVLIKTPGEPTFDAINRLASTHQLSIPVERLQAMAHDRAGADAEDTPWAADEMAAFEEAAERDPATGKQLLATALQRLADMQHDLIHGDFQQGKTLKALPDEPAVQNWLADRLRQARRTAYTIEREPHVADEKEPDLRFRARVSGVGLATEIKVAESWSRAQLEEALVTQLCGQYLRAQDGREGILLLVHQDVRKKGWQLTDGTFINFEQVVDHLRAMAAIIRRASADGPQPEIAVIDVSSCAP